MVTPSDASPTCHENDDVIRATVGLWQRLRAVLADMVDRAALQNLDRRAVNDIGYHRVRAEIDRRPAGPA